MTGERANEDPATTEENSHRLHIRIHYDEHRSDLIVNIIEGRRWQARSILTAALFAF